MTSIFKRYRGDREIPFEKEDPNLIEDLERSYGIDLVEADIGDALQLLRDLIDEAMERQHISSHNKLSQILEIDRSTFSHWIHGRNLPSEKIILKLAALADADPDEALLIHRILHASTPDTKNTYHTMLRLIWSVKHAAAVLVLLFCLGGIHQVTAGTGIEQISLVDLHSVYYGKLY